MFFLLLTLAPFPDRAPSVPDRTRGATRALWAIPTLTAGLCSASPNPAANRACCAARRECFPHAYRIAVLSRKVRDCGTSNKDNAFRDQGSGQECGTEIFNAVISEDVFSRGDSLRNRNRIRFLRRSTRFVPESVPDFRFDRPCANTIRTTLSEICPVVPFFFIRESIRTVPRSCPGAVS